MTLTKFDMAESLSEEFSGLNHKDAVNLIDATFEQIRSVLAMGEEIKISGLGNFMVREKKERPGRNPRTLESIPVSARRVVTFKTGQKLKAALEAGLHKQDDFDAAALLEE